MIETYLDELVVEITRRCDLECQHCLRGPSENQDMRFKMITRLCERLKEENICLTTLTITGGEPTLNLKGIKQLRRQLHDHGIEIHNLYMAINGQRITDNFIKEIREWDTLCNSTSATLVKISGDSYHPKPCKNYHKVIDDPTFVYEPIRKDAVVTIYYEGNARINFEEDEIECWHLPKPWVISGEDDYTYERVYINVYGDVYSSCNLSYERQRTDKENRTGYYVGNINEGTLKEMIRRYDRKIMSEQKEELSEKRIYAEYS